MSKSTYPLKLPLSIKKAAQRFGEGRWRVFEPMDRGSGRRKSWSGGNCSRLLQETSGECYRRRAHEASADRAEEYSRGGRQASIGRMTEVVIAKRSRACVEASVVDCLGRRGVPR